MHAIGTVETQRKAERGEQAVADSRKPDDRRPGEGERAGCGGVSAGSRWEAPQGIAGALL